MIAEAGHYALVLALALALIQSIVPIVGARRGDVALMEMARSTAVALTSTPKSVSVSRDRYSLWWPSPQPISSPT